MNRTLATPRPATDPTNLAGLVTVPRHLAPFQSFEAERREHRYMKYGARYVGRHLSAEDTAVALDAAFGGAA